MVPLATPAAGKFQFVQQANARIFRHSLGLIITGADEKTGTLGIEDGGEYIPGAEGSNPTGISGFAAEPLEYGNVRIGDLLVTVYPEIRESA
jgi:hypothetical protein